MKWKPFCFTIHLYPAFQDNLLFPLSFYTHKKRAPTVCRSPFLVRTTVEGRKNLVNERFSRIGQNRGMKFTKSSRSGHDFAIFIDYAIIVPRKYRTISPISPSPLQQHTQQRTPAPCRGPLSQLGKGIHKTFKRKT